MKREEMTLEKAEKIVDNMYQSRWEECGVCEGNTIHMGNLDNLQYTELERASILLLRVEMRLSNENTNLKQALLDIREYVIEERNFNNNQIREYKTCIETNLNGNFNDKEKENMKYCMSVNICINYKLNDILQIIDKVLGSDKNE